MTIYHIKIKLRAKLTLTMNEKNTLNNSKLTCRSLAIIMKIEKEKKLDQTKRLRKYVK